MSLESLFINIVNVLFPEKVSTASVDVFDLGEEILAGN